MRDVVVGFDGSTTSWRALCMAIGVAHGQEACVHACYVSHRPVTAELVPMSLPDAFFDDEEGGCAELRAQVFEELARAGARGEFVHADGDVARELEAVAEACSADMIVVGRSRHPAVHLGGVPRRLLAIGRRPVLVVP